MKGTIVSMSSQPGTPFASVTLQVDPVSDGVPPSSINLTVPLADIASYELGVVYDITLTPETTA